MVLWKAGAALALPQLAEQAGYPRCVLTTILANTLWLSAAHAGAEGDFTGSTRLGKLVAEVCAEGLKKDTLELGGNCAFFVFHDSDLDRVVERLMRLKCGRRDRRVSR